MPHSGVLKKFFINDSLLRLKFLDMKPAFMTLFPTIPSITITSCFNSATVVDKFETSCVMLVSCACSNWMASVCR